MLTISVSVSFPSTWAAKRLKSCQDKPPASKAAPARDLKRNRMDDDAALAKACEQRGVCAETKNSRKESRAKSTTLACEEARFKKRRCESDSSGWTLRDDDDDSDDD
jgi:hypothetical protein